MGLDLGFLSRAGAAGASGYLQGQQQKRSEQAALQEAALKRLLTQSTIDENQAHATQMLRPPQAPSQPAPHFQVGEDGTLYRVGPDGQGVPVTKADGTPLTTPRPEKRDPVADHKAMRAYDQAHPIKGEGGSASDEIPIQRPDGSMVFVNRRTRQVTPVMDGNGQPLLKVNPTATPGETERGAVGFAARMESAEPQLAALAAHGGVPTIKTQLAGRMGPLAERIVQTPAQQQFAQLARDWVAAKLRKESGAAISAGEFKNEYETYFPQPGDSPEVVAQKAERRRIATAALKSTAGRAGGLIADVANAGQAPTDQQKHWDALAQRYGEAETTKQIGPRP